VRIARPHRWFPLFDALQSFEHGGDGALDGRRIVPLLSVKKASAHQPVHVGRADLNG